MTLMTGPSPWAAPPETGPQQAVVPPPPTSVPPQYGPSVPQQAQSARPPGRGFPWLLIGGAVVVLIAVIAATAAITFAIARNTNAPSATPPNASQTPATPQPSSADQAAAKQQLCHVFDVSVRGKEGQGGVIVDGNLNVPLVLRKVNSVLAVQNALTPAAPPEVAAAAKKYIDTSMDLTTAAMSNAAIDELTRLTKSGNDATYAFADECGLPH
jgi:hypothetical protein